MDIQLKNLQTKVPLNLSRLKSLILAILSLEKISNADLSFTFLSNRQIAALNKKYLGRAYTTDVLSFDLRSDFKKAAKNYLCGEIIISLDKVKENIKVFHNTFDNELALYVIHGILHFVGYDDCRPADIVRMRKEEARILKRISGAARNLTKKKKRNPAH